MAVNTADTVSKIDQPNMERWQVRFFTIWVGQAFSMFGSGLVQFALIWWITQTAGTATALSIATLVGFVPQVVLGPLAGTFVDRWNRRFTMMIADSITALCVLILAVLFALGIAQIWHIYVLMFIRSACGAFQFPAMQASTSLMVPKDQLTRIGGMNQTLNGLMSVLAPPAGALLISLIPMQAVLAVDVITAAIAVGSLFFVSIPQPPTNTPAHAHSESGSAQKTSLWQEMREGLRFVLGWRAMALIMLVSMVLNLVLTPTWSLIPLLVKNHFHGGAAQLATLEAASGISVIAGGLILSVWGGFKRRAITSIIGVIGIGVGVFVVGLAPPNLFVVAIVGNVISGVSQVWANGGVMSIFQSLIPHHMQGRVMALVGSASMLMTPISLVIAGPVSDALGLQVWYWVGGGLCVLIGFAMFLSRSILNIESDAEHANHLG